VPKFERQKVMTLLGVTGDWSNDVVNTRMR